MQPFNYRGYHLRRLSNKKWTIVELCTSVDPADWPRWSQLSEVKNGVDKMLSKRQKGDE